MWKLVLLRGCNTLSCKSCHEPMRAISDPVSFRTVPMCACMGKFAHDSLEKCYAMQHKREMAPEALTKCTGDSRSCGNRSGFAFICLPTWRTSLVVETYVKGCPGRSLKQNRKFSFAVLLSIVNHVFFTTLISNACTFLASEIPSPVPALRLITPILPVRSK